MNNAVEVREFESLTIGESASVERTIRAQDVQAFAEISGDYRPLHMDDAYALASLFRKRVVHGSFLSSLVSQLVGMKLPGKYALLMRESLEFKKPVFIGDTIVVLGTIIAKSEATRVIELAIVVRRGEEVVATGSVHASVLK